MAFPHESVAATFAPLVSACKANGISRTVAFELARAGKLDTFTIGTRRYVRLDSLRTLPERIAQDLLDAARDAKAAA